MIRHRFINTVLRERCRFLNNQCMETCHPISQAAGDTKGGNLIFTALEDRTQTNGFLREGKTTLTMRKNGLASGAFPNSGVSCCK